MTRRVLWALQGRQLKTDDDVLLVDKNVARGKWELARVVEVYPGRDGVVRNIKVKTKSGMYTRSLQRCCSILDSE